jgi:hypothetical protein
MSQEPYGPKTASNFLTSKEGETRLTSNSIVLNSTNLDKLVCVSIMSRRGKKSFRDF